MGYEGAGRPYLEKTQATRDEMAAERMGIETLDGKGDEWELDKEAEDQEKSLAVSAERITRGDAPSEGKASAERAEGGAGKKRGEEEGEKERETTGSEESCEEKTDTLWSVVRRAT